MLDCSVWKFLETLYILGFECMEHPLEKSVMKVSEILGLYSDTSNTIENEFQ